MIFSRWRNVDNGLSRRGVTATEHDILRKMVNVCTWKQTIHSINVMSILWRNTTRQSLYKLF